MRAAKRIGQLYPDVVFLVVGSERVAYGGDLRYTGDKKSFARWVLSRDSYDPAKVKLLGNVTAKALGRLLAATDLHIYLTAPFVLSWSMMDAMSCGAVVLGSDTGPVREMIVDGENGLLADFFDVEGIAQKAVRVLRDPAAFRPLGRAAEHMIGERYSVAAVLPKMLRLYEEAADGRGLRAGPASPPLPGAAAPLFCNNAIARASPAAG
jgi:glycosyltransferase involved in cell wall biosynthesis